MTLPLVHVKSPCPPSPPESHAYCLCMCTYTHRQTITAVYSISSSAQRQSVFFICASGSRDSSLSPLHADLQNPSEIHTHTDTHTHSLSPPLRPLPPGSRYGFVKSWRRMNGWIDGSGEGRAREVENEECRMDTGQ